MAGDVSVNAEERRVAYNGTKSAERNGPSQATSAPNAEKEPVT